jgi:hypothetical protein
MRRLIPIVLSLLFFACLEQSVSYSPEADDRAMASITRAWTQAGGDLAIELCEDLAAPAVPSNDCQVENVVRGGGRGTSHSESRGGGCGGCPFDNLAYVKGSVSGGGFAAPARVTGSVYVGDGHSGDDPYSYPYTILLSCDDAAAPCRIEGTLEADGSLHVTTERDSEVAPATEVELTPTGAASCPL